MSSAILFDEPVIAVQPALVRVLGGHAEAAFAQQVHFRAMGRTGIEAEGFRWAVAPVAEWCEEVALTPKQAKRIIATLSGLGVLVRWAPPGTYDRTAWSRIDVDAIDRLRADPTGPQGTDETGPAEPEPTGPKGTDVPLSREVENTDEILTPSSLGLAVPDPFEAFWNLYPRRVAKPEARKAWAKIKPRVIADVMVGLSTWCAYWQARAEPEFVPHPATWLRREGWADAPPPLGKRKLSTLEQIDALEFDAEGNLIG